VPDTGKNIAIWGIQYELGAFPTSYIPTTSATVTRAADNASMVGSNFSSWYNQSEGTIYAQAESFQATSGPNAVVTISDGTVSNRLGLRRAGNSAESNIIVVASNTIQVNFLSGSGTWAVSTYAKSILAYEVNNFASSFNASNVLIATSGTVPVVSQMDIGYGGNNVKLNGHIQSIKYYPTRLPNADLQRLTR
jgi:hypothetical protein